MAAGGGAGRLAGRAAAALALIGLLGGCAGALPPPRRTAPGDGKRLAGEWHGTARVQQAQAVAIRGVICENGAFYTVARTSPDARMARQMRIVDGEVVCDAATSAGTMTFHETATGWIWKWQGATTRDRRAVTTEPTRSK